MRFGKAQCGIEGEEVEEEEISVSTAGSSKNVSATLRLEHQHQKIDFTSLTCIWSDCSSTAHTLMNSMIVKIRH